MTRSRRSDSDSPLPHISELDISSDDQVGTLFDRGLPNPVGPTLLACLFVDGRDVLPTLPLVEDSPATVGVAEAGDMVGSFAYAAAHLCQDPGLVIVWKRRGHPAPTDDDLAWARAAPAACASRGVRLLGVWLIAGHAAPLRLDAPGAMLRAG